MDIQEIKSQANKYVSQATRHPAFLIMARMGFVVSGLLHIMIGWIALRVATGSGGEKRQAQELWLK